MHFIVELDAYKDFLERSYKLIEELTISHRKDLEYYNLQDEISFLSNETEYRDYSFSKNESIIITWQSAALIGIISILEKGIQDFCVSKDKDYEKGIDNFKTEKKIQKKCPKIELLWKYIQYRGWILPTSETSEMMKDFKKYNTVRNYAIHNNFYSFPIEKYTKESLIQICNNVRDFLYILYFDKKEYDGFSEI